ncbi:pyridoxamine 5'-phosphate oxidase family protein [Actinomadura rupiterrae]|uniref:pyridoxamine 5'-phosphate oxidase family protein n=1 Tax=Actinomadura rupiterrae TaxID=559627 RepID=UPI0020A5E228|nr:pyridoxamine 5'-phosphate oxidase family protein [Actinomadura rupiterrae]MCP2337698.1 nitroimidazol reductase NimA-like FMN-containing flavoprotein (pyridoxamine 5'-phosphate oxidase superfamily) [Actinomadura rupiterrae]
MPAVMTVEEREAFLAEAHVGVLAVEREGRAPLAVPIWYDYEPGGQIVLWTGRDSVKGKAIRAAGRFSLAAQSEELPYKYVTVEGRVVSADEQPSREQALTIARRYLPGKVADVYVDGALTKESVLIRMLPERWLSSDLGKDVPAEVMRAVEAQAADPERR